jgi:putative drug exporter of the RND superfamily
MIQAGFVIGIGLLVDTFIVRTITVPALAVLIGNANWWPSGWRPKRRARKPRSRRLPSLPKLSLSRPSLPRKWLRRP